MTTVLQGLRRQARPIRLTAVAAAVVALCIISWLLHRFDDVPVIRGITGLVLFSFIGFAVVSAIRAARHTARGRRWPWTWLTVGILMYCTSFVTWGLANMAPSYGDAAFPLLAL